MGAHQKITDQPLTSQIQLIRLQLKFMRRKNHQIKIKHRAQARETNYRKGQFDFCRSGLGLLDSSFFILKSLNHEYCNPQDQKPRILTEEADN